jgi:lactose/L-arabinose transport system permease protein
MMLFLTKGVPAMARSKPLVLERRRSVTGWAFLTPAALLIVFLNFYPMVQAAYLSFRSGKGTRLTAANPWYLNYARILDDQIFRTTIKNTLLYLVVQVPIMLTLALILATMLNNPKLRFKGLWRTAIFLPSAVGLVSYALVFRTLFANNGLINHWLTGLGITDTNINWLNQPGTARLVIILGLLWRWTGYNMVFYLAALQNVDPYTFEAARVDGAGPIRTFFSITIPQLRPMILLTAILSTNGTLQMFDESYNLTGGGPANQSMSMAHYLYEISFHRTPNFPYASAVSYVILLMVAVLALFQMRVGDRRD